MEVKDIINTKRIELGLTMKELADKVGVSEGTISRWESGEIANMRRDKILSLANALKISPAIIMGWDENSSHKEELSEREHSHIITYRSLSDPGKDRVDSYTEKVKSLEADESDQNVVETFQKRLVARNGNKNLSPSDMKKILEILDNQ